MTRVLILKLFTILSTILALFLSTAVAVPPVRLPNRPPELPAEPLPPPPRVVAPPINPLGSSEHSNAPFSKPESEQPDLVELAKKISELIQSIVSLYATSTTSSSPPRPTLATPPANTRSKNPSPPLTTPPPSTPNATLACQVFSAYTSLCPPVQAKPYTMSLLDLSYTVGAAEAAASARASCLCYSSAYYVPDVYDNAAWACAQYPTATASADTVLVAAATAAAAVTAQQTRSHGFCWHVGNVRAGASYATFGQVAPTPTVTATPAVTATTTSAMGSAIKGAAGRLGGVEGGALARAVVVVAVAALV